MGQDSLSAKQQRFCEEYVVDWNGTRAAKAAGYSESTARQIATENLTKPVIQAYIKEIQDDLKRVAGVSALRNILELKKIAYANVADYKDGWTSQKDWDDLTEDQKAALAEITTTTTTGEMFTTTTVKLRTHNKLEAIKVMNQMLDFNASSKLEIKADVDGIDWHSVPVEERRKMLETIKAYSKPG